MRKRKAQAPDLEKYLDGKGRRFVITHREQNSMTFPTGLLSEQPRRHNPIIR